MERIDQEGVFCVVGETEVEVRTRDGWRLIGVIPGETVLTVSETEGHLVPVNPTTSVGGYVLSNTVMKTRVIKTNTFLMRRDVETELGKLGLAAEVARQDAAAVRQEMEDIKKKYADFAKTEDAYKREKEGLERSRDLNGTMVKRLEDSIRAVNQDLDRQKDVIKGKDDEIAQLQARLGKTVRLTAFERLVDTPGTDPSVIEDPFKDD